MIVERVGDLFAPEHRALWDAVGHQVNARGAFGRGFAGAVARHYPAARAAYRRAHEKHGWRLGQVLPVEVGDGRWVVHLCGQDGYGAGGPHTDYDALGAALVTFARFTAERELRAALPRLGCGLAGGEWPVVRGLIETAFEGREVLVFRLEGEA